ncbi:sigma-70 family RNA polymerase sigma factor [Janthinobacterium agaricidamnosum]|uniref:RNA polymerase sigma factor n=1 Tax=Janthinobacterium agaricidamnosum NBRC 102515 = DSM 9628 TaxID=1349767 RepID=W0VB15_9BURK|nr:sigma-70 family RNA polymerase sigma factor [Janthinobacterium agaricidamnosum]CDG85984.1 RNA polymerase sigma factor, sigma-70 family protein [Janthinobacterium agaricidamnosum NBRC 102515 = DSM 9628]
MQTHTPENQRLVDLLARVALKDHASFQQLYSLTCDHLYGVSVRIVRKRELADEILQEAYINVWEQAGSYAATLSTPMTWLITVVRNKALDRLRKDKLEFERSTPLDAEMQEQHAGEHAEGADPHQLFAAATEKIDLNKCLSLLEAPHRQSLALAYYSGMSHAEVACHLQVPLGTAKAWLRRGLEKLKKCYDELYQEQRREGGRL